MTQHLNKNEDYRFDIEWFSCTAWCDRVSRNVPDGIRLLVVAPNDRHFFTFDFNLSKDEIQEWAARQIRNLLLECDARVQEYGCQLGKKIRPRSY